jgi:hypothetical protein
MNTASTISINVNARFRGIGKVMRCTAIHKAKSPSGDNRASETSDPTNNLHQKQRILLTTNQPGYKIAVRVTLFPTNFEARENSETTSRKEVTYAID